MNGFVPLTAACTSELGSDARMCTSSEIRDTPGPFPTIPSPGAWVRPVLIGAFQGTSVTVLEESAVAETGGNFSCLGWTTPSLRALAINSGGQFREFDCNQNTLPVACCAPLG
jgi:hypothetical protein